MAEDTITYSLKYQARCLAAQLADKLNSKWIVGTTSLRDENEVKVLQYDPDQERLTCVHSYIHPSEVWDIAPCSASESLFLTVWSKAGTYGVSLWQTGEEATALKQKDELKGHEGIIRGCLWHPTNTEVAVTVEEGGVRTWSVSDQGAQSASHLTADELVQLWSGQLHPRNPATLCTTGGNNIQVWDLKAGSKAGEVSGAHRMPARDVSFAPHNDHRIVSAGDDCKLRFWDLRMLGKSEALLELGGHSHWVWKAQYNPFHDQLLASSSSDCLVNLYFTPQLASSTADVAADTAGAAAAKSRQDAVARSGDLDGKAHTYDEHEDSVYGLAWSAVEPWLFASLSYDGRVVMNKVPKNIKYKVLV